MTDLTQGPKVHVADHEILRSLKRDLPLYAENLMTFYVPETDTWVLGEWVNRDRGLVREFIAWGPEAGPLDRDKLDSVKYNLNPDVKARAMKRWLEDKVKGSRRKLNRVLDAERERIRDRQAHVRRKVGTQYSDHPSIHLIK